MPSGYRPYLKNDPEYVRRLAGKIPRKPPIEEIKFGYLNEAFEGLGFSEDIYQYVTLENLASETVLELVRRSFTKLSRGMRKLDVKEKIIRLWDYLSESDPLEKADLIFTFGGQGEDRLKRAIDLFKEGYGANILFTGRKASYMPEVEIPEAEYYGAKAREAGVPRECLIIENQAINTIDNAVNSIKLLRQMNFLPKRIILINHNFQMRRSYLIFKTNVDWGAKLIRQPVAGEKYTRDSFWTELAGWQFVVYEYIKIYGGRLLGHF